MVYVYSATCETYFIQWYSIDVLLIGGGACARGICAFCYILNLFGVVVFHRSIVNWRRGPWYMCILLCVKFIWCSGMPYIYGRLEGSTSPLSICVFCYMLNLFGVVVFHRSMVNWRRGTLV